MKSSLNLSNVKVGSSLYLNICRRQRKPKYESTVKTRGGVAHVETKTRSGRERQASNLQKQ